MTRAESPAPGQAPFWAWAGRPLWASVSLRLSAAPVASGWLRPGVSGPGCGRPWPWPGYRRRPSPTRPATSSWSSRSKPPRQSGFLHIFNRSHVLLAADSATAASNEASAVSAVPRLSGIRRGRMAVRCRHDRQPPGEPGQVGESGDADPTPRRAVARRMIARRTPGGLRRGEFSQALADPDSAIMLICGDLDARRQAEPHRFPRRHAVSPAVPAGCGDRSSCP